MLFSLLFVEAALGRCQEGTDSAALQYKYRFFFCKLAWLLVFACMSCLCLCLPCEDNVLPPCFLNSSELIIYSCPEALESFCNFRLMLSESKTHQRAFCHGFLLFLFFCVLAQAYVLTRVSNDHTFVLDAPDLLESTS